MERRESLYYKYSKCVIPSHPIPPKSLRSHSRGARLRLPAAARQRQRRMPEALRHVRGADALLQLRHRSVQCGRLAARDRTPVAAAARRRRRPAGRLLGVVRRRRPQCGHDDAANNGARVIHPSVRSRITARKTENTTQHYHSQTRQTANHTNHNIA